MNQFKPPNSSDANKGSREGQGRAEHQDDFTGSGGDAVQRAIGSQLRAVYDEVVSLPVPDKFLALLSSLDAKPASSGGSGEGSES